MVLYDTRALTITSVVVGAFAVGMLALSVATDAWLFTSGSATDVSAEDEKFNTTVKCANKTQMGLWKVCYLSEAMKYCDSFSTADKEMDRLDKQHCYHQQTTFAILRATRLAALFPVSALIMITVAVILGIIGNIRQDFKTLMAAIVFILSGLTLAVGMIFYISAINDEVGNRSKDKGKQFVYAYGWSFFFAGIAFVIVEVTAVVLVTLYMHRNSSRDDMVRIIPGLEDKFDDVSEHGEPGGATNPTIIL